MSREAMKLALEALKYHRAQTRPIHQSNEAIVVLEKALAEPVGINGLTEAQTNATASVVGLVNTPPAAQRQWVELTGEMLLEAAQASLSPDQYDHFEAMSKHQPDIYERLAKAIGGRHDRNNS